jgi:hypothetical protein
MMAHTPRPLGLDQVADLLGSAQQFAFTDHGATRVYQGQCRAGAPFLLMVNTFDGLGFALRPPPRLVLVAANDPPA